jgi:hypothetical protein
VGFHGLAFRIGFGLQWQLQLQPRAARCAVMHDTRRAVVTRYTLHARCAIH